MSTALVILAGGVVLHLFGRAVAWALEGDE